MGKNNPSAVAADSVPVEVAEGDNAPEVAESTAVACNPKRLENNPVAFNPSPVEGVRKYVSIKMQPVDSRLLVSAAIFSDATIDENGGGKNWRIRQMPISFVTKRN